MFFLSDIFCIICLQTTPKITTFYICLIHHPQSSHYISFYTK